MGNFSFCHNVLNCIQWLHIYFKIFSIFLSKYFLSRLLQNCCMRERVKVKISWYSGTCVQEPPMGKQQNGLFTQVVLNYRIIYAEKE